MKPSPLLVVLAAVVACQHPAAELRPAAQTSPPPVETFARGTLATSPDGYTLTSCDSATTTSVQDATSGDLAQVWQMLAGDSSQGIYVEAALVDGRLVRVLRASPAEMNRCEESWDNVSLRARGNEPFWALDVTDTALQWRTPDGEATLPIADSNLETDARAWKGVDGERVLEAHVTRTRCVDSMSGEVLPWTAEVSLDGVEFRGCASSPPAP